MVSSNGTSQPQLVFPYDGSIRASSISEEGELVFSMGSPLKPYRISLNAEANPEREATELVIAPEVVGWHGSALAADGEWLAYASQENGGNHVYVRPFPNVADGKWQASIEPGFSPIWNPNKDELLYWGQNGAQVTVPFQVESKEEDAQKSIRFSRPDELFSHNGVRSFETIKPWDLSENRDLFYMITRPDHSDIQQRVLDSQTMLTVVENWFLELDSLAPPDSNLINPDQ